MPAEPKLNAPQNRPLLWSEGMLLTPQHFQQSDLYWSEQLHHQMGQLRPHFWGLLSMELDQARLTGGEVFVTRLHCVTPDGLVVHHDTAAGDEPLSLKLSDDGGSLRLYLAVPSRAAEHSGDGRTSRRYAPAPGALVSDHNTGEGRVEVDRLRPRLELWAGEEPPPRYSSLALCELAKLSGNSWGFTAYQPPMLRVGTSRLFGEHGLEARIRNAVAAIRRKTRELCGRPDPDDDTVSIHPSYRKAIHAIASALPPLEVMINSGVAHPFDLYLALAQQVGQLSSITANPLPPTPRDYDHDDVALGFNELLATIDGVLKSIRVGYRLATFDRLRDGTFEYPLEAGWKLENLLLELRARDGGGEQALMEWLGNARIGSAPVQELLRSHRLTGAGVTRVSAAGTSRSLPLREGSVLVKLTNASFRSDGEEVEAIHLGERLRIEGDGGRGAPSSVVLYHLDGSGDGEAAARN